MILVAVLIAFAVEHDGTAALVLRQCADRPAIILICGVLYLLSILVGVRGGLIYRLVPRKHLEA